MLNEIGGTPFGRFFIPGHKGRPYPEGGENIGAFEKALDGIYPFDVTEIDDTDNLNYPSGVLRRAEQTAAEAFQTEYTIFSVNGSSAGVISSVMTAVKANQKLLLPSNSHISCYYGALHSNCEVKRLYIKDFMGGVSAREIKEAIDGENNIAACVITSPTFFGNCADWDEIVPILHSKGIKVIADESHGTHIRFSDKYPKSALECGADLVIHSGHKTIEGLTQTSMLHINSKDIDPDDVRFCMRTITSTSPSYVLTGSLYRAVKGLKNLPEKLERIYELRESLTEDLSGMEHFSVLNYPRQDPFKFAVECRCDRNMAVKLLTEEYEIIPEMIWGPVLVFMFGQGTTPEDIARIREAFLVMDSILSEKTPLTVRKMPHSHFEMKISQAALTHNEKVKLQDSPGRISADFIGTYPPGAPVIVPGEIITREIADFIASAENVTGLCENNTKIRVVRE
ncbi:MAG: hypothetical protein GX061_04655 [Eubacteriaceae bacterium]|nr:hypothetical protein [Eubacteriaceae bacterium]